MFRLVLSLLGDWKLYVCVSHHGFFPKVFEVFGRATHEKEIRERRKRHLLFCLHIFDNLAVDQKIVCNNHEDLENEQANERKSEILFPRALHHDLGCRVLGDVVFMRPLYLAMIFGMFPDEEAYDEHLMKGVIAYHKAI